MKKTLRFSLLSLALMLVGNVMAQGVTIDFDADYAKLFPTLAGTSSNDSHDGDFTAATTSIAVEGFTVTVTPAEDAKTPSRIWYTAPALRMYSGTFTVSGKGIKKIEFTGHSSNFNLSTTTGTLDGKTWTGEADEVVFDVAKNTQINKIVINGDGGGGGDTPGPQTGEVQTVTIAAFNAAAESNDVWYQLTGTIKNLKDGDQYGNFDLEDETGSVYVYGVLSEKGGEKKKFQELVAEKGIKEGDKLTIIGNRGSYNDKIEVLNAYFVSVESGGDVPTEPDHTNVTVADLASATAKMANVNLTLNNAIVLYANGARVFVREGDKAILFYSLGIDDLKTNAILNGSIKGKLDIYNNLNEFCKTEYTNTDALTITQSETAAEPLTIDMADAKNYVSDLVKFAGVTITDINGKNANANLDGKTLAVYDQFGLLTDNMEGAFDVTGVITMYKENVQIYPISITSASGVKAIEFDNMANAPAYNLSGQQVSGSYRGLIIKNGRKFMVK